MSGMDTSRQARQAGYVSGMLISVIALSLALATTIGVAVWAFSGRQDYKNNSDQKVAAAVAVAKEETVAAEAAKFAEEAKNPYKSHVGPATYGSVTVIYPKTWSGYVSESSEQSSTPVDDYFHPDVVPDIDSNSETSYALRVQIVQQPYDKAVSSQGSAIKNKQLTSQPYALPKVPSVIGTRFEGELTDKKKGILVVLPLRNVTLQIWTEGDQYRADFTNIILANLSFSP